MVATMMPVMAEPISSAQSPMARPPRNSPWKTSALKEMQYAIVTSAATIPARTSPP